MTCLSVGQEASQRESRSGWAADIGGWRLARDSRITSQVFPLAMTSRVSLPSICDRMACVQFPEFLSPPMGCSAYNPQKRFDNRYLNLGAFAAPAPFTSHIRTTANVRDCQLFERKPHSSEGFPLYGSVRLQFRRDLNLPQIAINGSV